jgi:hypothetical protein
MPAADVNRGRRRSVNTRAPELATYSGVIEIDSTYALKRGEP